MSVSACNVRKINKKEKEKEGNEYVTRKREWQPHEKRGSVERGGREWTEMGEKPWDSGFRLSAIVRV